MAGALHESGDCTACGVLDLPEAVALRRPGSAPDWRVAVEEWETFPADGPRPEALSRAGRIIYADHLSL